MKRQAITRFKASWKRTLSILRTFVSIIKSTRNDTTWKIEPVKSLGRVLSLINIKLHEHVVSLLITSNSNDELDIIPQQPKLDVLIFRSVGS